MGASVLDIWALIATYGGAYLVINGLLALIPAYVAGQRGRSFGAIWALSFFLTLIVGLLVVMALPQVTNETTKSTKLNDDLPINAQVEMPEVAECPYCAEVIKTRAMKCRYCGEDVEVHMTQLREYYFRKAQELKSQVERERLELESKERLEKSLREQIANDRLERMARQIRSPKGFALVAIGATAVFALGIWAFVAQNRQSTENVVRGQVIAALSLCTVPEFVDSKQSFPLLFTYDQTAGRYGVASMGDFALCVQNRLANLTLFDRQFSALEFSRAIDGKSYLNGSLKFMVADGGIISVYWDGDLP